MANKKMKIWISVLTALTVVIAGITVWMNPLSPKTVSAGQYRNGYLLIPEDYDLSGVSIHSKFTLLTQSEHTLEEIVANFFIDGEAKPTIEKRSSVKFVITPNKPLEVNKLYTFRIQKSGYEDITWSFQTGYPFGITAGLPADRSTGVPINTGIEITFTHREYQDVENFFSVTPDVSGKFQRHGNTCVFVPEKNLQYGTLYTVTIKKGLALEGTDKALQEDFTFSFETQPEESKQQDQYNKGWFGFSKVLNDASSSDTPWIPVYYYIYNRNYSQKDQKIDDMNVQTDVYALKDVQSFLQALKEKDKMPVWASYSYQNNKISVTGLNKVMTFEQVFPYENKTEEDNYLRLPDKLPKGFYLINTLWEGETFQTFLQVTDIGVYSVITDKEVLIWLNTVGSGASIDNAKVKAVDTSGVFNADRNGIVAFSPDVLKKDKDGLEQPVIYLQVTAGNENSVIRFENTYRVYYDYYGYYRAGQSEDYWSTFQLDRQLYKPNDTVNFWGFLKERDVGRTIPSEVTVEIGNNYYRPLYVRSLLPMYQGQPMEKTTVKVQDGLYQGQIKIPNLQPGSYGVTVKDGDTVLASSYITVKDYVKPSYKMEISSNKKAVYNGEPIEFIIKAAFFEGTPVSNLNISYNLNFYAGEQYINGEVTTDQNGEAKVTFVPQAKNEVQGIQTCMFYARAELPETGEISASHYTNVFVNDIHVQVTATLEKEQEQSEGKIEVQVNRIDLDKYNSSEDNDYMGGPVKGKKISGEVLWNTWERIEIGKYYDYINKVTYPRYEYVHRTETVETFTVVTDGEGKAIAGFTPLKETDGYYTVSIRTEDQSGRTVKYDYIYVSGSYRVADYYPQAYQYYYLEKEKDKFKPGETVDLTYKYGEKALEGGKFLFIKAYRGYLEWEVRNDSKLEFAMEDSYAPNIYVCGVWFNNRVNIVSPQEIIYYDYTDNKLELTAQTDKETYRPGDVVTVKLSADKGPGAFVNLSVVDEALFALNEQYVNTLEQLFRNVSSGLLREYRSHTNSGRDVPGGAIAEDDKSYESPMLDAGNRVPLAGPQSSEQVAIREEFKDTALFKTVQLDENGKAIFSFTLPDNVTQWRITLSGVTKDLKAGTDIQGLDVSLPFFINYAISDTFLNGDKPVMGITGYGTKLNPGDQIQYSVKDKETGNVLATAVGAAFERVNVYLPVMKTAKGEWIIEAITTSGLKDAVSHTYKTIETYHRMQVADYTDLTPYTVITGKDSRNLTLIFTDRTRGKWLPDIYSLSWTFGNRFEQKLGSKIAYNLLVQYFEQEPVEDNSFQPKNYQVSDGGLGILPYASSDVFVTAWAAELVKDEVDIFRLKEYLYGMLETETAHASRAAALYGLASLKEPVLLELDKYAAKDSLSTEEALYLVLAYQTLGEKPVALDLYNRLVAPSLDRYDAFIKVKKDVNMNHQDDTTRTTALAALAAVRLDLPESEKLMNYVRMHPTEESLINLQKISYVLEVIDRIPGGSTSITYSWLGKEISQEIGPWGSFTMNIPGAKAGEFRIKSIEGNIGLVTVYEVERNENIKTDPAITVSRSYSKVNGQKGNIFNAGDIVQVTLNVTIKKDAMDNYYKLSDYLPAGLRAIETPVRPYYDAGDMKITHWYKDVDGQKVSFYVFPYKDQETFEYTYYARIVSPGQYTAEKAVAQGVNVLDSTAVTADQIIYIQP